MAETREDDIIRVATARHPIEAHIWRQALETEGVRCQVVGDYLDSGEAANYTPELWVHRRDADLARAILQVYQQAAAQGDDEDEDEGEEV
jgi:putative signal transducing protein